MFSRVKTVAFSGIKAELINIEVHLSSGIPGFIIVGLANKAVSEAKERVKSALMMIGISLPAKKITINLSPANVYKEGNHYDLGIAIAILVCIGAISQEKIENFIFMGELSLNGEINEVNGILPAGMFGASNGLGLCFPSKNLEEAMFIKEDLTLVTALNLKDLISNLNFEKYVSRENVEYNVKTEVFKKDFSDVKGQEQAKRTLEIAATGGHDVLMIGRPGSGKSMLAERMQSILPPLSSNEMLEISVINSVSGNLNKTFEIKRPFRNPHHSSSMVALIGGGKTIKPGEISLAHNGILFLDEFAEFPAFVLDALRQPMETGVINIARAEGHVSFPCNFQLIAAMNPCKCGYLGDAKKECSRVPMCGENYLNKISGPILERIDIHLVVNPSFEPGILNFERKNSETSNTIKKRVIEARDFAKRERGQIDFLNAKIPTSELEETCKLSSENVNILNKVSEKFHLSLRECHKIIKIARTIADTEFKMEIDKTHILEAIQFRKL